MNLDDLSQIEDGFSVIALKAPIVKDLYRKFLEHKCDYPGRVSDQEALKRIGGFIRYTVTPASRGNRVLAKCDGCGREDDITDYGLFKTYELPTS